jgi:hypothetical protein
MELLTLEVVVVVLMLRHKTPQLMVVRVVQEL